jgi:uncharacterized protein (DUF3820 family)
MQAIEFTAKIQKVMIPIPEHYKDWFKKSVRIIGSAAMWVMKFQP